jgi:O-antigen ligase
MFSNHPWLGVGYQQTEHYITAHLAVHNGYLGTLADTGVVGFLGYMIFFVGALWRSLVQAWREPIAARVASAAYLTAYATLSLTEPTGLHIGNTLSMIMLITAAWSWRAEPSPRLRPARIKAGGIARPPAEAAYRTR